MNVLRGALIATALLGMTNLGQARANRNWTHFGLRPLGMGNAFVAVADDYNSLYYNPAGIARLDAWDGELINPTFIFSSKFQTLLKDSQNLKGTDETISFIEDNTGEDQMLSFGLSPHLIFKHFGFGISTQLNLSMVFHREISVDVQSGVEVIIPFSYGMNFFEEKLSVGMTVKARAIAGVDREFSMEDINALSSNADSEDPDAPTLDDYVKAGTGTGVDFGLLFTPTKVMEPTIGLSITDFGGTKFTALSAGEDALGEPDVQLPSVNLGLSLKPYQKNRQYILVAMDMHSINQPHSFSRKLNFGSEFGWGQFLKAQVGLYKGYPTAGLQLDAGIINLKLLTYTEELGEVAGSKASPRYAFQLKLLL